MTTEFSDMLYLIGGKNPAERENRSYNVKKIKELADSQGIWTLVFPELEKYTDLSEYEDDFVDMVAMDIQTRYFCLEIISDLNKAGLKACLLKGAAVAQTYPDPSNRISADTDILILPEQEAAIISFLKERGYNIEPRAKNDHHFKAYHPEYGLLEGHISLYSVPTAELLFDGKDMYFEPWAEIEIEGFTVPVLGLNDGLIYLTAHYIKHLVNEGGGVRQMLDLLYYMRFYADKLDFDRYTEKLRMLRYDKLVDVIRTVGAIYWGFDYPQREPILADKILTDSEEGGIFGFNTKERNGFYQMYCAKRCESAIKSKAVLLLNSERRIKHLFFPTQEILLRQKEYSYAKNKLLIPIAWVHRFIMNIIKRVRKITTIRETTPIDNRLNMMRELNMIK